MKVGIGVPATIPWTTPDLILRWMERADESPFSSLGILDRLVYPNYEPMVTLAAAAALTRRVRLITTVLLAPLRNTAILAKQAASVDALSGGRLTLGLGVGAREDDFVAAEVPFHQRGKRFERQLDTMERIWSGQPLDGAGKIGPSSARQGGPEVLIGGYSPPAVRRVGRWGDGYISGGAPPEQARRSYALAREAWSGAGRQGEPRIVGCLYFALGPDARERGGRYIRDYYAVAGPLAEGIAGSMPASPEEIKRTIDGFADAGADEVICWPTIAEPDQLDLLADLVR